MLAMQDPTLQDVLEILSRDGKTIGQDTVRRILTVLEANTAATEGVLSQDAITKRANVSKTAVGPVIRAWAELKEKRAEAPATQAPLGDEALPLPPDLGTAIRGLAGIGGNLAEMIGKAISDACNRTRANALTTLDIVFEKHSLEVLAFKEKCEQLQAENNALNEINISLGGQISELNVRLSEAGERIAKLEAGSSSQNDMINLLEAEKVNLKQRAALVEERDAELQLAHERFRELEHALNSTTSELVLARGNHAGVERLVAELREERNFYRGLISERGRNGGSTSEIDADGGFSGGDAPDAADQLDMLSDGSENLGQVPAIDTDGVNTSMAVQELQNAPAASEDLLGDASAAATDVGGPGARPEVGPTPEASAEPVACKKKAKPAADPKPAPIIDLIISHTAGADRSLSGDEDSGTADQPSAETDVAAPPPS